MATRKQPSQAVQKKVLTESKRRCAFCFGLEGDLSVKDGQIAHIDRDPSNSRPSNLAYLCLSHHAEYDRTSRHEKGLMPAELREYKDRLVKKVEKDNHLNSSPKQSPQQRVSARANPTERVVLSISAPFAVVFVFLLLRTFSTAPSDAAIGIGGVMLVYLGQVPGLRWLNRGIEVRVTDDNQGPFSGPTSKL